MRILGSTYTTLAILLLLSTSATAHPGHEGEMGLMHVIASPQHVAMFLAIGATAAIVTLIRHAGAVLLANGALALFLFSQGASHATHNGILFGVETALAGVVLALGAWRATYLIYLRVSAARKAERS